MARAAPRHRELRELVQGQGRAEHLARLGMWVDRCTPDRAVGHDPGAASYPIYLSALARHGVGLLPDHRLVALERKGPP
jgi:hypothetical protein